MKSLNAFPCSSNAGARLRSGSAGRKGEVTTSADIGKYPPGFVTGQGKPDPKAYPIPKKKPARRFFPCFRIGPALSAVSPCTQWLTCHHVDNIIFRYTGLMIKRRREMKAEQRSSIRKKISLNIVINYDLTYSKRWKVRDLSLGGAMVEMRRDELLPG